MIIPVVDPSVNLKREEETVNREGATLIIIYITLDTETLIVNTECISLNGTFFNASTEELAETKFLLNVLTIGLNY